jgi:hypothetical protein
MVGCLICIILIATFCFESYVLMILWNWLSPLFWSTAPTLGFWECVGIISLINLIGSIIRSTLELNLFL